MTTRAVEDARRRHQRTLHEVFARPTTSSLRWRDLMSMLESFGGVHATTSHEKERITLSGHTLFLHRPHGHNHATIASPAEVAALRRFLKDCGLAPPDACGAGDHHASPPPPPPAEPSKPSQGAPERVPPEALDGRHALFVVDHAEARLYRHFTHGAPATLLHPHDPLGTRRHLHAKHGVKHQATPAVRGDYAPVLDARFANTLMDALQPFEEVIVAGHGTGKSSAVDALLGTMHARAPALARRVVHRLHLSEGHVTENELLASARAFYNERHDTEAPGGGHQASA